MAFGMIILAATRPYGGLVLTGAVGVWMLIRLLKMAAAARLLVIRTAILPFALVFISLGGWMAYYNWRVTGSPTTLPYQISFNTYLYRKMFLWQTNRPRPSYRHPMMQEAYAWLERPDATVWDLFQAKFIAPLRPYLLAPFLFFLPFVPSS